MRSLALLSALLCGTLSAPVQAKHKPLTIGNLTVNPSDVIAVYRPVDQQAVAVYIAKPGGAVQTVIFKDFREAGVIFDEMWKNPDVVKDPGDDDARPLTRMMPKDAEKKAPTLIVNVERVLAMAWDTNHRYIRIYIDRPVIPTPLYEPNSGEEMQFLMVENIRQEADQVMAAYKACVYQK